MGTTCKYHMPHEEIDWEKKAVATADTRTTLTMTDAMCILHEQTQTESINTHTTIFAMLQVLFLAQGKVKHPQQQYIKQNNSCYEKYESQKKLSR